jgi:hypothetical protein
MKNLSGVTRHAIVHIGTEKTGTTTIQSLLASRRAALRALGYWYPTSPGAENHNALSAYASPDTTPEAVGFDPAAFAAAFADEMANLPPNIRTVIFSNELCQSRLITTGRIARLRSLLAPYFDRITILVYLRRQDETACSLYSTALRLGETRHNILPPFPERADEPDNTWTLVQSYFLDYERLLDRYAAVFGKPNVQPRIFERDALLNGNVAADFLAFCGLPPQLADGSNKVNKAIPADGQAFLALLNDYLAANGAAVDDATEASELRDICATIAENNLTGPPRRPSRAEAQHFYAQFRGMNERVCKAWFPERRQLFSDDFSQYPNAPEETGTARHEQALRGAFELTKFLVRELRKSEQTRRQIVTDFHASLSWRLTTPVRGASLLLRRLLAS